MAGNVGLMIEDRGVRDPADTFAPEEVALRPRNVQFDWSRAPLRWIPSDPYASHGVTALNLFLPVAERWFSKLLSDSLVYVRDEHLREEIVGFVGQEAVHARTHDIVLAEYLRGHGIDPEPFTKQLEWVAGQYDLRIDQAPPDKKRKALASGTHALSAAEHYTGVLGNWALNNRWDELGADPTLTDLYRWHGAEEVEHRHVSFNVAKYFGMDYFAQAAAGVMVTVVFFAMMLRGTKYLVHQDPALPKLGYLRLLWRLRNSGKSGALPSMGFYVRSGLTLLRRDYSPVDEGSTAQAVAYLASSPAARAAHG